MSYIHTPDGFRKDFLKKLIQSGAAPDAVSIAAYGSKEGILSETHPEDTFSEFLGFKAPRPVVKLDTKWGKVFIYSVKCNGTEDNGDFKPEDFVKKVNEIVSDISEIKTEEDFVEFLNYHLDGNGPIEIEGEMEEELEGGRNLRLRNNRYRLRGGSVGPEEGTVAEAGVEEGTGAEESGSFSGPLKLKTKKLYSGKEVQIIPLVREGIVILSELISKHNKLKRKLSNYTVENPICIVETDEDGDDIIDVLKIDKLLNGNSKDKLKKLIEHLNEVKYYSVVDPYLATSLLDILNYPVTNVLPWGNIYPSSKNFIEAIILPQLEKEVGKDNMPEEGNLVFNLTVLARSSNRHLGNENFRAQPKRLTNGFLTPYEIIDNRTIATDVQVNAKQILEQLHNNIKNLSAQSVELLNQKGEKISLVIKNDSVPNYVYLKGGMPQMGGGSAVLNLGHAQAIRSFFELKRKVLRGKGKDFSDNTWDKLMSIVDDMQQKENLLVTYSHSLKNAEFDSAGNVRDVASFNNTLKKKENLVLQLAGSYVKVSSIADVMMGDLEQ